MIKDIEKIKNNIYLYDYVFCSVIVVIGKFIFAVIDGDVLIDTLRIYFRSMFFGSYIFVKEYMTMDFRAVGPLAILLICHFGLYFVKKLDEVDLKPLIIISPIAGIGLYILIKYVLKGNMPFSLLEAALFASILYPIRKFIKVKVPDIIIYVFILVISISGIIYMFME